MDLRRKSEAPQLKQEVFDGARDQIYEAIQARVRSLRADQRPATGLRTPTYPGPGFCGMPCRR